FQRVRKPSIPSPMEEDKSKIRDKTGTIFIQAPSILILVWRSIMFNGSFLRVCRILRFVKKIDFAFLSLGGPSHGARVWCLGRVPKHRNHWQELEGLLFSPKNSQLVHIFSFRSYLRSCMNLRIVQKIRFSLHESGWIKAWCPGLVSRPSAKASEPFELLFLGCGFLIHLSNRS